MHLLSYIESNDFIYIYYEYRIEFVKSNVIHLKCVINTILLLLLYYFYFDELNHSTL